MALVLEIRTTSKKAAAEIKALATKAGASVKTLEKQSVTSSKRMTSSFSKLSGVLGGLGLGLGLAATAVAFNKVVGAASDTEESLNKVREVFGKAAISVEKFSETAAESLGASTQAALAMTGEIGNLLVAMKFAEDDAAGFSTKMVQLAADLGSFNNVPTADALNAIRSALVGESEPIRRFGADVRQTRLDSIALGLGLEFTKGKMDAQTKALAAMEAIMQDTRKAHGDFRRTSDGLANSQKILGAQFEDLKSVMGERLMPVMKGAVDLLTGFIKAFTESEFDKAIGRLIELGADVNFINQLKAQNQINESLKDRTRIAKEINDFELMTGQITLDRIADNEKINKMIGADRIAILQNTLAGQLKIAKETGDTKKAQETINELQQISFNINEKLVRVAIEANIVSGSTKRALEATENILIRTVGQSTQFLINLKEQEAIEKRIKDLKLGQADDQDKIVNLTQRNLEMVGFLGPQIQGIKTGHEGIVGELREEISLTNTIADATERWEQETEAVKQKLFEAAGALNQIIQLASGAQKFSISGLLQLGATIARFIPGGQAIATGLQVGAIATRGFQQGGSFTVPGTGSGDRPHLLNLEPGERVDVTPRNQVTTNNNMPINITINTQTVDEKFVKFRLMPALRKAQRQGFQLT